MIYRKALVGKRAKSGEGGGIADRSDRAGPGAGTEKLYPPDECQGNAYLLVTATAHRIICK